MARTLQTEFIQISVASSARHDSTNLSDLHLNQQSCTKIRENIVPAPKVRQAIQPLAELCQSHVAVQSPKSVARPAQGSLRTNNRRLSMAGILQSVSPAFPLLLSTGLALPCAFYASFNPKFGCCSTPSRFYKVNFSLRRTLPHMAPFGTALFKSLDTPHVLVAL